MSTHYNQAAKVVKGVLSRGKGSGTIKSLTYSNEVKSKKKVYALVCETLKYRSILEELLTQTKIAQENKKVDHHLLLVMVYDLVFGGNGIEGGGQLKKAILRYKSQLHSALVRLKIKHQAINNEDLLPAEVRNAVVLPRYVRVNTLKRTLAEAFERFTQDGFTKIENPPDDIKNCDKSCFWVDKHIDNLLVFPPSTDFHAHEWLADGAIVLQDKASCFPAQILQPEPDWICVDGCAAPGNKTSHLAAILQGKGKVYAIDKSTRRLKFLEGRMENAGAENVQAMNTSFLDLEPKTAPWNQVSAVLLDPSCSGSGIVQRLDHLISGPDQNRNEVDEVEDDGEGGGDEKERLRKLAEFQLAALKHAMSFPSVKRITYSTCSVHQIENEDVVAAALEHNPNFSLVRALPSWNTRGWDVIPGEDGTKCVRTIPGEDFVIGFFVACFERKGGVGGKNKNKNKKKKKKKNKNKNKKTGNGIDGTDGANGETQ